MGEIKTYRDLHAWQVGMDTMTLTYELTPEFPLEERYTLTSHMRRASQKLLYGMRREKLRRLAVKAAGAGVLLFAAVRLFT